MESSETAQPSPELVNREEDHQANDALVCQNLSVQGVPFQAAILAADVQEHFGTERLYSSSAPASSSGSRPEVGCESTGCNSPNDSQQSTGRAVSKLSLEQSEMSVADGSNDSDVVVTNEKDCTQGAQDKRSKSISTISHPVVDDGPAKVEELADEEKPPPSQVSNNRILSAQRAVLSSLRDQMPILGHRRHLDEPEKHRLGQLPEYPIPIDDLVDVSQKFVASMQHDDEDNTWMEDNDGGADEAEEVEKLRTVEANLKKRKTLSQLSEVESYELKRASSQLNLLKRRKEVAERSDEKVDSGIFVPERANEIDERGGEESDDAMFVPERVNEAEREVGNSNIKEGEGQPSSQAVNDRQTVHDTVVPGTGKAKKRRNVAKNAREVEERRREKERERSQKRSAQTGSRRGPVAAKITKDKRSKKGGRKSQQYKSRTKKGSRDKDDALSNMLDSLMHSDAIKERLAQEDEMIIKADEIHERSSKKRQMDALMANIPDNYDIHKSQTQRSDILRASRSFGYKKVVAADGKWKLKGMKSSLYHYQLLAAEWMVKRELGEDGPHGGILADAMGLGKTLEVLAVMVGNPPPEKKIRGTLLVLPSSVIKQWQGEIGIHTEPDMFPRIIHYSAQKELPQYILTEADIILTSYKEVMMSYPYPGKREMEHFRRHGGYDEWVKANNKVPGALHQIEWYRIVLDEAHEIKNFQSRTSVACQNLKGRNRWAVTGTPVHNRVEEFYPYFCFLRVSWASDYQTFRKQFCDTDAKDSQTRLGVALSIIMRRTLKDKVLGRPIVSLPIIHPTTQFITFSKEETVLYRALEDSFRNTLNSHIALGTAEKNYSMFMVQLLRLRQCTAHPFLLESTMKQILSPTEIDHLKSEFERLGQDEKPIYEQIRLWETRTGEEPTATPGAPIGISGTALPFGRSEFGKDFRMIKYLNALDPREFQDQMLCRICSNMPTNPQITDCDHIFCNACLMAHMHREALMRDEVDVTTCPACKKAFSEAKPYKSLHFDSNDDTDLDSQNSQRSNCSQGSQSSRRRNEKPNNQSIWLSLYKKDKKEKYLVPSAKTIAFKAQVLKWLSDSPTDKILVFTQFRPMVEILCLIAESENWGFVRYAGDMNRLQRDNSVTTFRTDPKISLMICTLKCGGQGLNLTCANRVISLDPWWNHSVEQQAFGRVFRITQEKETYATRFIVKNTVDGRILDLQSEKICAIDNALQDTGDFIPPLSIQDLASLFGHLREDEDGKYHIESDYEDEGNREVNDESRERDDNAEDNANPIALD